LIAKKGRVRVLQRWQKRIKIGAGSHFYNSRAGLVGDIKSGAKVTNRRRLSPRRKTRWNFLIAAVGVSVEKIDAIADQGDLNLYISK